jgi:hypothetical protein
VTTEPIPAAPPRSPRLSRDTRLDLAAGGIVVVVYAIVQLALLLGPQPFDPAKYFDTAVEFPNVPRDYWTLRIGLIAPVRIAVLLFGPSGASLYGVPFALGLVLAGSVFGTMLLLFRERVLAAAAALVTSLNASYLLNSSFIFPDTAATATFAAAFLCLVLAARAAERGGGRAATVAVVSAGVLLGWTYLIREFSPILLPAVIAALVLLRYTWRRAALLAGAAIATASLELLYGWLRYGEAFVHAQTVLDRRDKPIREGRRRLMEQIQEQLDGPLDAVLVFPRLLLSWDTGWIFVMLVAVFAVGLVLFRDRRLWLLAAWFLGFWAVMAAFGLWRLPTGELIVNVTNIRYWYPIFPPLVMGAFGTVYLLVRTYAPSRGAWLLAPAIGAALAVTAVVPGAVEFSGCAAKDVWRNDPAERWGDLRAWFGTAEAQRYDVVRTDNLTKRLVPAYSSSTFGDDLWDGRVERWGRSNPRIIPKAPLGRSLILVHKPRFATSVPNAEARLQALRREWAPVFRSDDERMIVLAHDSALSDGASDDSGPWWEFPRRGAGQVGPGECGLSPYEAGT